MRILPGYSYAALRALAGQLRSGGQPPDEVMPVVRALGAASAAELIDAVALEREYAERVADRRVELVTPESLSPYLGPHILREVEYVRFDTGIPAAHPQ